jgi:hypothetical protein
MKFDRINAVVEREPLRQVPSRLTAKNVAETLQKLGFSIPTNVIKAADESQESHRFGTFGRGPSPYAIPVAKLDAALAQTALPIHECLRLRLRQTASAI